MDIAVLWDVNIESKSKYREKVDHYKDLAIMLFRLWQKQATIIIAIIVGLLGCVKSNLHKALKDLPIEAECRSNTKDSSLASAYSKEFFYLLSLENWQYSA